MKDKFYQIFKLDKVKWREPAREVDDDGNVCAWYINEDYPPFTDQVIVDLICLLAEQNINIVGRTRLELIEKLQKACIDKYQSLEILFSDGQSDKFVQDIRDVFQQVYWEYEDFDEEEL